MNPLKSLQALRDELQIAVTELRKSAFQPIPSGPAPGGQPPMDPSMMGGAGGMPMDPAMAGGMPPQGQPPAPPPSPAGIDPTQLMEVMSLIEAVVQQVEMLGKGMQQLQQFMRSEFSQLQEQQARTRGELDFLIKTLKDSAPPPELGSDPASGMPGEAMPAMADPAAAGMA